MRTIRFTKRSGKVDKVSFFYEEAQIAEIDNPKQRIVPHDMVHYAVEKSFPFKGFVTLVFEGQAPESVVTSSGDAWFIEGLVEVFQACLWNEFPSFSDFSEMVANICAMRKVPMPPVSQNCFESCRQLLEKLSNDWNNLPVEQTLTLEF